jgi:hypothetical protein
MFKVILHLIMHRTLLNELIIERAHRYFDKNLFESEEQNFSISYPNIGSSVG